ncbi:uncharacterized protein LOC124697329 [Lolium rigidum]|uniref:uncharacterized protein LOC124697329 n=1 Tax=Lolium rigidum TaxID=89674 RepID=UPI001F5DA311|nr:uncharacterized protein LOC124697329 [Lolium rigidum]
MEHGKREAKDLEGGGVQASPDKIVPAGDLNDVRGRSAYLVACHWDWSRAFKPFSVYKMDVCPSDAAPASGRIRRSRLRRAASLEMAAGGKTFAVVRSRRRAWIVGAGGTAGDTVFFDTETRKVIAGPALTSAKWNPILTAVGDRVYAMSSTPSWVLDPNFPPWFEVLDLSEARVVTVDDRSHLEGCSWSALPIPPCMPWMLSPFEYHYKLPMAVLMSYAVVGPYILVSFNQTWGTHALDTNSLQWHKVDDERLPFFGCADPQGGSSIFLALSKRNGPLNAYRIRVADSGKDDHALKLSITVLPVRCMEQHEVDEEPCFASLDNGRFCSLSLSVDSSSMTLHPEYLELFPRKARVNLRIYQIENPESLLDAPEETLLARKPKIRISSQWERAFKISNSSQGFCPFSFTLLFV